jgi:dihydroxyacetone kinase
MKKLINAVPDVVKEQLEGMAAAHPDLIKVHFDPDYVYRADAPVAGKVAIISGGGSGHEPMHGGFVGMGMLDAACPGAVFTSPTPDQMYEAAKAVNSGAGVLFLVKNYTGDVLNFEMAADMAYAEASPSRTSSSTTTWLSRTASTLPAGAASARPSWSRRSSARRPRLAITWSSAPTWPARPTATAAAWAWP